MSLNIELLKLAYYAIEKAFIAGHESRDDEVAKLKADLEVAVEVIRWYANEPFYEMESFITAALLQDLSKTPQNIEVQGNPIMHDKGKRAREVLEKIGGEG